MINRTCFALLSFSALFGCDQCETTGSSDTIQSDPCCRFGTKRSYNFFATGEIIWFEPLQDIQRSKTVTPLPSGGTEIKNGYFDQRFKQGYRASIGCNTPYDCWDLSLIYTGLRYKHNNPYSNTTLSASGTYSTYQKGSMSVNYELNMGDLDLGRCFKISKYLNMRPHLGVRGVFLNEKQSIDFSSISFSDNTSYAKVKNSMGGIFAAIDSYWTLYKGLSLYGNGTFAALANTQHAKMHTNIDGLQKGIHVNHAVQVIPMFDFFIGLRYDINFSENRYHFGINIGYEQHIFLNLNPSIPTYVDTSPLGFPFNADFSLQGISIGARFDF